MSLIDLQSPYKDAFRGRLDRLEIFEDLKHIIPFKGTNKYSAHGTLKLYYRLAAEGTSHNTCIQHIILQAFCGDVDIVNGGKAGLRYSSLNKELADDVKERYCEFLESFGLSIPKIQTLVNIMYRHVEKCGNGYWHYVETKIGGQIVVKIKNVHPMNAFVLREERDVFNKWLWITDDPMQQEEDPKMVSIYPNFSQRGKDTRETIFHFKNETGESDDYGYPKTEHTIKDQMLECIIKDYDIKIFGTKMTAAKIAVIKDCSVGKRTSEKTPAQIVKQVSEGLRPLATNEGKRSKELAVAYIPAGHDMTFEDLTFTRDAKYEESKLKEARHSIYAAHGCHVEDTGADKASASVLGNVTNSISLKFDKGVVRKHQQGMSNFIYETLHKTLIEASGREEFKGYRMVFSKDPVNEKEETDVT